MSARSMRAAAVVLAAISVAAVVVAVRTPQRELVRDVAGESALLEPAGTAGPAPRLTGITGWHNSTPMSLDGLRRRRQVVVVDFWTYTCINCRRTFPFLRRLHDAYGDRGLTIVGVHSPEFDFEKIPDNVERAIAELGVTWPVAEDPNLDTWQAYGNQFWPAKYLIDADGRLRGQHIGEGDEAAVERAVRVLLAEAGHEVGPGTVTPSGDAAEQPAPRDAGVTPEVYLGAQRGDDSYGAGPPVPGRTVTRSDPRPGRHRVSLTGRWTGAVDYVAAAAAGARLDAAVRARDVYVLLAPQRGAAPAEVEVRLDDAPVPAGRRGRDLVVRPDGRTVLVVDDDDLRHVLTGDAIDDHALSLIPLAAGPRLFTFTFGG